MFLVGSLLVLLVGWLVGFFFVSVCFFLGGWVVCGCLDLGGVFVFVC